MVIQSVELENRMRQVRALLESRFDYLPSVHVTDLGDRPGPAPSKLVPCDACDEGRVVTSAGRRYCSICDGQGWRRRRAGEEEWDHYTERPVAEVALGAAGLPSKGEEIQRLTSSIDRIQADLDARAGRFENEQYAWEKARKAYFRGGSYAELDRALAVMAARCPRLHAALVLDVSRALPRRDEAKRAVAIEIGVAWIATEMRGSIRVPKWISYERSVKKAPSVRQLALEGMKAPQIAKRLGLSKSKVKHLLRPKGSLT